MEPSTEVELLRAELAELRKQVAELQVQRTERPVATPTESAAHDADQPESGRRGFLRLAGAAAVGATAVAIAGSAQPAAAATGGPLNIGVPNNPTNPGETTTLVNPGVTTLSDQLFMAQNYTNGGPPTPSAEHRAALAGLVSGVDNSVGTVYRTGVFGRTTTPVAGGGGQGVFGSANGGTDNTFADSFAFGVVGTAPSDGYGVFGYSPTGTTSVGVIGRADAGFGVIASSFTGVSLLVRDGGRLQQDLRAAGAPIAGTFSKGEMIRDGEGDMYICTVSGTPGTWRKVTAQHPDFANAGGSINLLPRPIRLVDTRGNGAPITNGSNKLTPAVPLEAQITGTVADTLSVPAGAKGILGNLTATEAVGNGFALVWPAGQPQPATSNLNYSATTGNPAIANYFISAIDATGKLNIMCAVTSTHILVDVFGFVF